MPIKSEKSYAPEKLIKIVYCACKQGCTRQCSCVKAGLPCSAMCTGCTGTCTNCEEPLEEDAEF